MKITSLIPSKGVARHLESIGYELSALQCAFIIATSNQLSVTQKHI